MKKLFILGGSGDIGKAIISNFSGHGYSVISPSRGELDLEDEVSIDNYFKNKVPGIDVLIHCAGWNEPKPFEGITTQDLEKSNSINIFSFLKIIQYLSPIFKKRKNGYILGISSLYGSFARNKRLGYVISKHALNGLIKTLAIELGQYNIKINTLSPGFVDTKMTRKNNNLQTIKRIEENIPLGRLAIPDDIAKAAYFLCSCDNNYISGQDIVMDGGYSVGGFQK